VVERINYLHDSLWEYTYTGHDTKPNARYLYERVFPSFDGRRRLAFRRVAENSNLAGSNGQRFSTWQYYFHSFTYF